MSGASYGRLVRSRQAADHVHRIAIVPTIMCDVSVPLRAQAER
jgi:hypothetical protein